MWSTVDLKQNRKTKQPLVTVSKHVLHSVLWSSSSSFKNCSIVKNWLYFARADWPERNWDCSVITMLLYGYTLLGCAQLESSAFISFFYQCGVCNRKGGSKLMSMPETQSEWCSTQSVYIFRPKKYFPRLGWVHTLPLWRKGKTSQRSQSQIITIMHAWVTYSSSHRVQLRWGRVTSDESGYALIKKTPKIKHNVILFVLPSSYFPFISLQRCTQTLKKIFIGLPSNSISYSHQWKCVHRLQRKLRSQDERIWLRDCLFFTNYDLFRCV